MNHYSESFSSRRGRRRRCFFSDQHLNHGLGKAASDRPGVRLAANWARLQPSVATTTDQMTCKIKLISVLVILS